MEDLTAYLERERHYKRIMQQHLSDLRNEEVLEWLAISANGGLGDSEYRTITAYFPGETPYVQEIKVSYKRYFHELLGECFKRMKGYKANG